MSACYLWQAHREEPCPVCSGTASPPWPHDATWPEPVGTVKPLTPAQLQAAWTDFAVTWLADHPGETVAVPISVAAEWARDPAPLPEEIRSAYRLDL